MTQQFGDQNYIYLYDLPKEELTSQKIASVFETQGGVVLANKPQIRRDFTRPFYSGIIQIKEAQQFSEAAEKMRYFQIGNNWCRALKFDKQLLGSNKEKLHSHNVFVRSIPLTWHHPDLHEKFQKFGAIKSLKVSNNADGSSRGYGFICYQDEQSAIDAVAGTANDDGAIAIKFEVKQARSVLSLINNVYVKNIPESMTDEEIKGLFSPFGNIESMVISKNEKVEGVKYGFVCYSDPNKAEGGNPQRPTPKDPTYGAKCAQAAIEGLHGKKLGENLQLYVRAAMKAADRNKEKVRETLRYKQSKKRCNLYVKNFPPEWTEEQLKEYFERYGETERGGIKIQKTNTNNVFAFVCFKSPDSAASAKQHLHNQNVEGKTLIINHYEIKEFRDLAKEEAMDKQNYEQYMAQKTGGFHLNDLVTHPHMTQILQQLLEIMQNSEQMHHPFQQDNRMRGGAGRGGMQGHRGNYQNRGGQGNYHQGGRPQHMNNMGGQGQMPQAPNGMPQAPQMAQPPAMAMPPRPNNAMPNVPAQMGQNAPLHVKYQASVQKILPSCTERNPLLKEQVGQAIFEHVSYLVPHERAPKVTGMLIEIPVDQIRAYMMDYNTFKARVHEANTLIDSSEKQMQTQQ